ncbi:hypothetical protein BDR07DRAFT_1398727, partial [Suillus spraguei]
LYYVRRTGLDKCCGICNAVGHHDHSTIRHVSTIQIFLIVIFLANIIFDGVAAVMATVYASADELIFSGTYQCMFNYAKDILLLDCIYWILETMWEVLALCLVVWIAVKHFRELRQHREGRIIGDCFIVLTKTHMFYFVSFVAASCF